MIETKKKLKTMASPRLIPTAAEEANGPDTQMVGRLLWEELHGNNSTQQPVEFEWLPLHTPAIPAAILQTNNNNSTSVTPVPSASQFSTPEVPKTPEAVSAGFVGPPNLASWRKRLFQLNEGEVLTLSLEQRRHYWPFMSNVWTKSSTYTAQKRKQTIRTHWNCRLYKNIADISLGKGLRNRNIRQAIRCQAKLVEIYDTLSETHVFSMEGHHNHPLTSLDETKINDGIKIWVENQILQGFSAVAIVNAAAGKGKDPSSHRNLLEAGGCKLDTKYVRNAIIRLNVRPVKPRHVIGNVPVETQAREALEWLQNH